MIKNYLNYFLIGFCLLSLVSEINAQNVALNFDGVDDEVQTSYQGISGNNPRTIEAWIQTTKNSLPTSQGGNGQSTIVDWGSFVTGGRCTFNVLWSNAIRFEAGGNGLSGAIPVNDGQWHHVAMTYDPTSFLTVSLYVDGVLDATGNLTVPVNTVIGTNLRIGERIDNVNRFEGGIDEVRIYDYAKTLPEIIADMNREICGAHPNGLVAYYKFNEGVINGNNTANTIATDYEGGIDGVLNNFALTTGSTSNWVAGPAIARGNSYGNVSANVCDSLVGPSGNNTWYTTGVYTDTFPNSVGCDSILTVNLTVGGSDTMYAVLACDSFTSVNGNVYTSNGTFSDTLVGGNTAGCDSIITIDLSLGFASNTISDTSACGSLTYNGNGYFASTTVVDTFINPFGCDSLYTLNITINPIQTFTDTVIGCDSVEVAGTWYNITQQVFNNYMSSAGCDSSITTYITVNSSSMSSDSIFACDSMMIEGVSYDSSQIVVLNYNNVDGCDSTHTIDLVVESIMYDLMQISSWEVIFVEIPGATYSWYSCLDSTLISSDTIVEFYAPNVGLYYAEISVNGCAVTTPCYNLGEGVIDIYNSNFELTPNPNSGRFIIDLGVDAKASTIQIMDLLGRTVYFSDLENETILEVSTDLSTGMYVVIIDSNKGKFAKKFMIK